MDSPLTACNSDFLFWSHDDACLYLKAYSLWKLVCESKGSKGPQKVVCFKIHGHVVVKPDLTRHAFLQVWSQIISHRRQTKTKSLSDLRHSLSTKSGRGQGWKKGWKSRPKSDGNPSPSSESSALSSSSEIKSTEGSFRACKWTRKRKGTLSSFIPWYHQYLVSSLRRDHQASWKGSYSVTSSCF